MATSRAAAAAVRVLVTVNVMRLAESDVTVNPLRSNQPRTTA